MAVATEQANFLRDAPPIYPLGADVRTEKQVLFFIIGGRTVEDERLLRLCYVSVGPALLLRFDRNRMCAEVEIKPIGHVRCQTTR